MNCIFKREAYFFLFIFLTGFSAHAQYSFQLDNSTEISVDGEKLQLAWAGGLNSGQYSSIDLNGDGNDDLAVFDRTSNVINTFLSEGDRYVSRPEYAYLFPEDIRQWMLLVDYDCDGKKDLFTNSLFGIRVFKNTGDGNLPSWELVEDPLFTEGLSGDVNLQINSSGLPAIADIDSDGDIDILSFDFSTGVRIEYHQNQSMERDGVCGLDFKKVDSNWGQFEECNCGDYAFGETCEEKNDGGRPTGNDIGRTEHAGAKSLLAFDNDGDGDMDILFGNEPCESLTFLENVGDAENATFENFDDQFPNNTNPIGFPIFPAGYYLDLDFDGKKDLISAPNTASNISDETNFAQSSWFYNNIGDDENPDFVYQQKNFLQSQSLDLGQNAVPTFLDLDNDGDQDLVVSNYGLSAESEFYATLTLLRNNGTAQLASFDLEDSDFLDLSGLRLKSIKVQFVDLNKDGVLDLTFMGTDTETNIYYVLANGPLQYKTLDVITEINDSFFFHDIDKDGNPDLLIGRRLGKLEYYKNTGSVSVPSFVLEEEDFAGIAQNSSRGNLVPRISDLNNDGIMELVTTDASGELNIYQDFRSTEPIQHSTVIHSGLNNENIAARFGSQSWSSFADLNADGFPEMVVGTVQGGLLFLKNTSDGSGNPGDGSGLELIVFPNPSPADKVVKIKANSDVNVQVYSILGQAVGNPIQLLAGEIRELYLGNLSAGIYLAHGEGTNARVTFRFIVSD